METNRREFVRISLLASAGLATSKAAGAASRLPGKSGKKLKILVLGGTGLIGPPMVTYAMSRGHELTLFNRGKTRPDLFPELEKLRGDRDGNLASIEAEINRGRRWDAVIDNTASIPRWARLSAELLKDAADVYLYTSSVSAYAGFRKIGITEDDDLAILPPGQEADVKSVRDITGENYGALKALCEQEVQRVFPGRSMVCRPGLIVGPGDYSDRFSYWPVRIARGGEILAPGEPSDPVQFIDCRDLGEWYVRLIERRVSGVFNALGPRSEMTMAGMLHGMRATMDNDIRFTWVDAAFLSTAGVAPWSEMTVWIPPEDDELGAARVSNKRAVEAGLSFRPLADTCRDTLAYWNSLSPERKAQPRAGLAPEKEARVLRAWHARTR